MNKYEKAKIYRLVCNITGLNYYGSTVQQLHQRKSGHKTSFNRGCNLTSSKIIEGGNYDIILVEEFPCENKNQLEARERYYIDNNECINKNIPTRTNKEYYKDNKNVISERHKKYNEENEEKVQKLKSDYYKKNKEALIIIHKEYRNNHKLLFNNYSKKYREANKELIKQKDRERYLKKKQAINTI